MKIFTGKVVTKEMAKTATVSVERVVTHPVYRKKIKRIKKYHVHDNLGVEVGQTVKFIGSKPYSKTKKWRIIEIISGKKNDKRKLTNKKSLKEEEGK